VKPALGQKNDLAVVIEQVDAVEPRHDGVGQRPRFIRDRDRPCRAAKAIRATGIVRPARSSFTSASFVLSSSRRRRFRSICGPEPTTAAAGGGGAAEPAFKVRMPSCLRN
jgi:hypothetical protein